MRELFDRKGFRELLGQVNLLWRNPLWFASIAVLVMAYVLGDAARRQLVTGDALLARLNGTALVDALRAYSEASPPGQPARPTSLQELLDDVRGGQHRAWLDGATAQALQDPRQWELVRDQDGRVMGAKTTSGTGAHGLWSGLGGNSGSDDAAASRYVLQSLPANVGADPATSLAGLGGALSTLPRPAMPENLLPGSTPAATAEAKAEAEVAREGPGHAMGNLATNIGFGTSTARVANALGTPSPANAGPAMIPPRGSASRSQPSSIIAGLEARQVLRLTGNGPDEPVLVVPRKNVPPARPSDNKAKTADNKAKASDTKAKAAPAARPPATKTAAASTGPSNPAATKTAGASRPRPAVASATSASRKPAPVKTAGTGHGAVVPGRAQPPAVSLRAVAEASAGRRAAAAAAATAAAATAAATAAAQSEASASGNGTGGFPAGNLVNPGNDPATSSASDSAAAASPFPLAATKPAPPTRIDTVIFENGTAPATAEGTPGTEGNCRALAGDSTECDALADANGALYQRCYQSLSERINACLAGDTIPPLITR